MTAEYVQHKVCDYLHGQHIESKKKTKTAAMYAKMSQYLIWLGRLYTDDTVTDNNARRTTHDWKGTLAFRSNEPKSKVNPALPSIIT